MSDLVGRVRFVPDRRSNSLLVTANLHFFPQIIKLVNELDARISALEHANHELLDIRRRLIQAFL